MPVWTNPEGARWLGALLLAYYDHESRLVYTDRAPVLASTMQS
jgi:hypothetical protein